MYISVAQLSESLKALDNVNPFYGITLLALLQENIPVGHLQEINFASSVVKILEQYYKPDANYEGYFSPFLLSKQESGWKSESYPSSLSRIARDTFRDAFIRERQSWGWSVNYLSVLEQKLGTGKIPAFDLAVWLYRRHSWSPATKPTSFVQALRQNFLSGRPEIQILFDFTAVPSVPNWLVGNPISDEELFEIIGPSPATTQEEGAALELLEMKHVGPAEHIMYEPAARLNLITGDNSLGKTFLMDTIWWGLTGEWLEVDRPLLPREDVSTSKRSKTEPQISIVSVGNEGRKEAFTSKFSWEKGGWGTPPQRITLTGLVVYARHDGSFAVWDPTYVLSRAIPTYQAQSNSLQPTTLLDSREVWYGKQTEDRRNWFSNGLIRDWVTWQIGGIRYANQWEALRRSLEDLSPSSENPLIPAEPIRLPFVTQEVPGLQMPYGTVPITNVSAGVRRITSLAYMLVWSWFRHLENSHAIRREPQKRLVLLVDEIEAHLHPRWQRTIVPALMKVVETLMPSVSPQIHIATHSPLVLASTEPFFDETLDDLHHLNLDLTSGTVMLEEVEFVKQGRVDMWLMSDIFGLEQARSLPAEQAIEDAVQLQRANGSVTTEQVAHVHERLKQTLPAHDTFWSRWTFFAEKHGVDE